MTKIRNIFISFAVGAFIGVIAAYGDTLLNDGSLDLLLLITKYFNTPTLWAISAFGIGTLSKSKVQSAFLGILLLLTAVLAYYFYGITLGNRVEIMMSTIIKATYIWSLMAIVFGMLYGLAGSVWKYTQNLKERVLSFILLPVLIISDNGYYLYLSKDFLHNNMPANIVYIGMILIGIALPFLMFRKMKIVLLVSLLSIVLSFIGIYTLSLVFGYLKEIGV